MRDAFFSPAKGKDVKTTRSLLCLCGFLVVSMNTTAQSVQTILSATKVTIGEPFELLFVVKDIGEEAVKFPTLTGKGVEVIDQRQRDSVDRQGNRLVIGTYRLMLLQPGEFILPEQSIIVHTTSIFQKLKTPPVSIYVDLLPVAQPDLKAEPLATISYTPQEWMPYALGTGILLLAVLGWLAYRRQKVWWKKYSPDPKKRALTQLRKLQQTNIGPGGQVGVTDKISAGQFNHIVREYLTGQFGIAAHYLTIPDLLQALAAKNVNSTIRTRIEKLLRQWQAITYNPLPDTIPDISVFVLDVQEVIELLNKESRTTQLISH